MCFVNDFESGMFAPYVASDTARVTVESAAVNALGEVLTPPTVGHMAVLTAGPAGVYTTLSLTVHSVDATAVSFDVRWVGMDAASVADDHADVTLTSSGSTAVTTLFNA